VLLKVEQQQAGLYRDFEGRTMKRAYGGGMAWMGPAIVEVRQYPQADFS
jgi:hypothetical protein